MGRLLAWFSGFLWSSKKGVFPYCRIGHLGHFFFADVGDLGLGRFCGFRHFVVFFVFRRWYDLFLVVSGWVAYLVLRFVGFGGVVGFPAGVARRSRFF